MEVLRICLKQPFANYRPHYSMQVRHSYPLPPPSTVLGMIHYAIGKNENSSLKNMTSTIEGINLAIAGCHGGMFYDYQWLIKSDKKVLFTSTIQRYFDLGPDFSQLPVKVQILTDVELILYISMSGNMEITLEELNGKILEPENILKIGRGEDIAILDYQSENVLSYDPVKIISLKEKELPDSVEKYGMWVPLKEAEKLSLFGTLYKLPGYYKEKIPVTINKREKETTWHIRNFQWHDCVYAEPQEIGYFDSLQIPKGFVDEELNIPVFFLLDQTTEG